jgi:hypothetical protein
MLLSPAMLHMPRRFLVNPALTLASHCEVVPPSGGPQDRSCVRTVTAVARSVGALGASICAENCPEMLPAARIDLTTVTTTVVNITTS